MFTYYFNIGLIYLIVGFATSLIFFFLLGYSTLFGRFLWALLIGVVGSFAGGLLGALFSGVIQKLTDIANVNIFPPLITSFLLLWIFTRANERRKERARQKPEE